MMLKPHMSALSMFLTTGFFIFGSVVPIVTAYLCRHHNHFVHLVLQLSCPTYLAANSNQKSTSSFYHTEKKTPSRAKFAWRKSFPHWIGFLTLKNREKLAFLVHCRGFLLLQLIVWECFAISINFWHVRKIESKQHILLPRRNYRFQLVAVCGSKGVSLENLYWFFMEWKDISEAWINGPAEFGSRDFTSE